MNDILLSAQDITITFGGLSALKNVFMDIHAGDIHALVGPNGAGKTTFFNCINGFYQVQAGRLIFNGREIQTLPSHKVAVLGIARTFQNLELFPHLSALENVMIGRSAYMQAGLFAQCLYYGKAKRAEDDAEKKALEALGFLGIRSTKNKPVSQLPFVTRKLVELARALALEPKLLLLDEPASGMNEQESMEMARIIRDIKRELEVTILLVEHDMDLVMDTADKVTVLDYGTIIAEGPPTEIKKNPKVVEAFLGGS